MIDPLYKIETELQEDFTDRVFENETLIESYRRLGMTNRAATVRECGSFLGYLLDVDPPKLVSANFCKDRLCGMCAWRRSKKVYGQVSAVMDELDRRQEESKSRAAPKYQYVFLTLTVRNCAGSDLGKTIDQMFSAFHLFTKLKPYKAAFKGAFRSLEVTYNRDMPERLRFHPHLHVILAVHTTYFSKKLHYLTHDELRDMWQHCLENASHTKSLGYEPVVHVCKVRPVQTVAADGQVSMSLKGAVCEVSKYAVKYDTVFGSRFKQDQPEFDVIDHAVLWLSSALKGRRLCAFSGIFLSVSRDLKLDDLTDGDLVQTDARKIRPDVGSMIAYYKWSCGYQFSGFKQMTQDDMPQKVDKVADAKAKKNAKNRLVVARYRGKLSERMDNYENRGVGEDLYERARFAAAGFNGTWVYGESPEALLEQDRSRKRGRKLKR